MRSPGRTLRELSVVAMVLALVVGVIVASVQAEGERTIRPDTNDGGAWLINGGEGVVGHVNRTAGEVTGVVRIANAGEDIDTEQTDGTVFVVNRSDQTLTLVDDRTFQTVNAIETPPDLNLRVVDQTATIWTASPLRVWNVDVSVLREIQELDESTAVISDPGDGVAEVSRFGTVLAVATGTGDFSRLAPGALTPETIDLGSIGTDTIALTANGNDAVFLTANGALHRLPEDAEEPLPPVAFGNVVALSQPTFSGEPVIGITNDGDVWSATLEEPPVVQSVAAVPGQDPLPPLVFQGCIFVVTVEPAELTRICNGTIESAQRLIGATGSSLRLRVVNGWVWINDLRTGASWVLNERGPLDRIDDWGAALGDNEGDERESEIVENGVIEQRENPDSVDAELIRADEIDEDGLNEPPIARDDFASTRVDLPVLISALRNDEDPDGDVILITDVTGAPAGALVNVTGDRTNIQVIPGAGFTGKINLSYNISDGRGGTASARITLDVIPPVSDNRPPVAVTDVVEARAGASVSLNVLDNDSDPDGDSIVLTDIDAPSGSITFDGSGQVTFVPDAATTDQNLEISYSIRDTFGATANGRLRVETRLAGSNNEPDARNDSAVTVVGSPVTLNVLLNDTDPDGDAINVAGPPTLLAPDSDTGVEISLTTDGQLFFTTDRAGTYIYSYSIIDGTERDVALIRIDVLDTEENRPPIAVRDDVTIARGATATIFALVNDTDPDGDVVALENWVENEFLEVESFRGVGFIITVRPEAPDQVTLGYTITDGIADPVPGTVVIAVSNSAGVDQPPVVKPDAIEARPGSITTARVLLNDFDPEGGPLRIDRVSDVEDADLRIGQGGQEIFVALPADAVNGFSFSYDVVDEAGNRNAGIVDVRIVPNDGANRPPIARADTARTRTATPVDIPVLLNDDDPDGDAIRLALIVEQPTAGQAIANDDGTVTYTPDTGFRGTDRLAYVIQDQFGERAIGEVLIGVIPDTDENRPPTAIDDSYTLLAGTDTALLPVTDNDFDPDGDVIRITRTTEADSVSIAADARGILFTPPVAIEAESVDVTVSYRIDDGRGGTADGIATITILQTVETVAPVPADDTAGPIKAGDTIDVDVLANDIDPDGRREDLQVSSDDGAGIASGTPGVLTFTAGDVTSIHPYTVTDADGLTGSAFVTLIVIENVAPEVAQLDVETPYEEAVSLSLGSLATDADDDVLFFVCCDNTRNGSATINATAGGVLDVTFVPDPEFSGQAGFSYSVDDKQGHQVAASVSITVLAKVNSPPTATNISAEVEAGTTGSVSLSSVADDIDIPTGDVLSYSFGSSTSSLATLSGDTVTVTAPIDAAGDVVSFDFVVTDLDGETASASATVTITESRINPPTAVSDNASTTQGVSVTTDVLANDLDEIGSGLEIIAAGSTAPDGVITFDAAGTVTFAPDGAFFGTTTINYTIADSRNTLAGQAVGQLTVDVIGFPGIPPTPTAVADNATATITWEQPPANGAPIEEFVLESDQGQEVTLPPSSGHTFNGLENGVEHSFRIRALNAAGLGEWSDWSTPVTPDTEPQRAAAPTVTFLDEALQVDWIEPANDGSGITGYILEIGGANSPPQQLGNLTSYVWRQLTNGNTYQFRVTAMNASGNSDPSPWSAGERPLREPDAASPIVTTRGNRYLDLTWTQPADNGDPIIEYQLEMESRPGNYVLSTPRNYRWADLPNGVTQRYRVRSRNRDVDWSAWSGWSNAVKPCAVPLASSSVSATRGDTTAFVTWATPGDEGCALSGYTIVANGGPQTQSAPASANSHTFTGLSNGTSYTFTVIATNEEGDGPASGSSNAVTPAGPPLQTSAPSVSPSFALGSVNCSVGAPSNNGSAIIGYDLSVNNGPATPATLNSAPTASTISCVRSGLAPSTTYQFKIRACNVVGCGPWSGNTTVRTFGPPQSPSNVVLSAGVGTVSASWSAVAEEGPGFSYYYQFTDGSPSPPQGFTLGTSASASVPAGTTINLYLEACNDLGCSAPVRRGPVTPTANVQISISKSGISATGQPGCSVPSCEWVSLAASGLTANQTYTVECHESTGAFTSRPRTADSTGRIDRAQNCYFGFPGRTLFIRIVGVGDSNTIVW